MIGLAKRAPRLAVTALLSSCMFGGGTRTVSALELRAAVARVDLARLDPQLRLAIESGHVWSGASETELYLSRGQPHLWWNTKIGASACRIFVHHGADPALADLAITSCNGRVVGTNRIQPALPCWRLNDVGPRIAAAASYFDARPLDVQWQIVIGLVHRGQAEQDVSIAFGAPHSRGFDEREDGRRAEKLVFLDRSGDAYGLSVTLIDNAVVGWNMPAERTLTPEAQQRRLDAVEKRITTKIAEVEQLAIKQHAETVTLFNEVNAKQDDMLAKLTAPPTVAVATETATPPVRGERRTDSAPAQLTGAKTLTVNGRTYTDTANGELGKRCGTDNNSCTSPAYACELVTSSSGMCVPSR